MKITSSNPGFDPSDGTTTIISGEGRNGSIVWPRGRDGRIRAVDLYSRIYDRENELIRAGIVHLLSGVLPLYVVNEFPKSGGSWVGHSGCLSRETASPWCDPRSCTDTTWTPGA